MDGYYKHDINLLPVWLYLKAPRPTSYMHFLAKLGAIQNFQCILATAGFRVILIYLVLVIFCNWPTFPVILLIWSLILVTLLPFCSINTNSSQLTHQRSAFAAEVYEQTPLMTFCGCGPWRLPGLRVSRHPQMHWRQYGLDTPFWPISVPAADLLTNICMSRHADSQAWCTSTSVRP